MTKRIGIFDVNVDVRKILEGSSTTSKEAPTAIKHTKVLSGSISVLGALDVITMQMKVSRNRSRTSVGVLRFQYHFVFVILNYLYPLYL